MNRNKEFLVGAVIILAIYGGYVLSKFVSVL